MEIEKSFENVLVSASNPFLIWILDVMLCKVLVLLKLRPMHNVTTFLINVVHEEDLFEPDCNRNDYIIKVQTLLLMTSFSINATSINSF